MILIDDYRTSRLDDALDRGFVPHPDDLLPPPAHLQVPPGVDILAAFAAEVDAVRAAQSGGAA
jgi:hypothetical protein